jgi:predicted porin
MNRHFIVAAISVLAAGSALAQSSVTIYGRLNMSAEQQKNVNVVGTQSVLQNSASRIGFKGTEDLGGGLKASFVLEHGFSPDTGAAANPFWGRQSEVNLAGAFGMIRLGNFTSEAYYATADYISMHNHDTGTSEDKLYAYVGRNTNKIAYRTPELVKGLTLEGAVSAGEGVAGRVKAYDWAANWNLGALQLGAGYEKNGSAKQYAIRALYEMGAFTVGAYYQDDTNGYGSNLGSRKSYRLSGAYNVGASEFHLNYGIADDYSKLAGSKANQFTAAYNYNLSKRTKVYAFYTKVDNGTRFSYFGSTNSRGQVQDSNVVAVGVRHNF